MISSAVPQLISSGPVIAARSKLRRHPGMQRALVRVLSLRRNAEAYEHSFKSAVLACIRPGDCVWDVGANVGFYSELFAMAVGPAGKVISFEPSPACVTVLEERLRERSTDVSWEVVPVALSDNDGEAWLSMASGDTAPDNHLASRHEPSTRRVRTERGDTVVAAGRAAPRSSRLMSRGSKARCSTAWGGCSVVPHCVRCVSRYISGTLNARGKPNEPARIVRLLQAHAFAVKWIDRSHFVSDDRPCFTSPRCRPRELSCMKTRDVKAEVRGFWDEASCGEVYAEGLGAEQRFRSRNRRRVTSLSPTSATSPDSKRASGQDVLEIGVGMGADHLEWARMRSASSGRRGPDPACRGLDRPAALELRV